MASRLWGIPDALFIISMIGCLYYSYIIYVLLSAKTTALKSAFFQIFEFTGVFEIMAILCDEFSRADYRFGFGPNIEVLSRILRAMTFTNLYVHIFCSLLMTANRYTAISRAGFYEKVWERRIVSWILAGIVIVSYGICAQLFFVPIQYRKTDYGWDFVGRSEPIKVQRIMCATTVYLYELISAILIVATICRLRRQAMNIKRRKCEIELLCLTSVSVCVSVLEGMYDTSLAIGGEATGFIKWVQDQFDSIFVFMMTINAIAVPLLSATLREEIRTRWCRGNVGPNVSAVSMNGRSSQLGQSNQIKLQRLQVGAEEVKWARASCSRSMTSSNS